MENQRPLGAGRPGVRPPPGFEHLAPRQEVEAGEGSAPATAPEEQPSSTPTTAAVCGIFPFPPPRDSPRSPLPSPDPPSPTGPSLPVVRSDGSLRDKMEATNAFLFNHHHDQVVAVMQKKFQDLLDYEATKNRKILHVDWIAGNPRDPIKKAAAEAAHAGMSAEERQLSESVARTVMRVTHGVDQWDETATWNKALFYGDWLNDHMGFRQLYMEIQVKRISGADDDLLLKNGISNEYVWLPLHDTTTAAIQPVIVPPAAPGPFRAPPARELPPTPAPGQSTIQGRQPALPPRAPSMQVPTCSADKGKGRAAAQGPAGAAPAVVSSDAARPPSQERAPLPNIGNLALSQQGRENAAPSAPTGAPHAGIPRSKPLRSTGSLESLGDSEFDTSSEETTGSAEDQGASPPANPIPRRPPVFTPAELQRHREAFDRLALLKREELKRTYAFLQDPAFIERKNKSFVYAVRVVVIPERGSVVNALTGPPVADRHATLLGLGGWVVPPLEERVQRRDEHKRAYRNKGAKPAKYEGLPRPQIQNAMPVKLDWSARVEPRYYGPAPPVWREICDPCLEDIYWMAWQLLSGRRCLGFQPGTGFGVLRRDPAGDPDMLAQCPFKSPSAEVLYHSASYPRGKGE